MAKIFDLHGVSTPALRKRKAALLKQLSVPSNAVRASCVRQFLTCGKRNCRCRYGRKHGPFHYFVQCLRAGRVRKFLLKTQDNEHETRAGIAAYAAFQTHLEELSQINTELLFREESLVSAAP